MTIAFDDVPYHYTLTDDGSVVQCRNLLEWGAWMESARKSGLTTIGDTKLKDENDEEVRISTVFLGLDHCLDGGPPMIFELMIFGGRHNEYQHRFATMKEARAWHLLVTKSVLWEIQAAKKAWDDEIAESGKPWKRNLIV